MIKNDGEDNQAVTDQFRPCNRPLLQQQSQNRQDKQIYCCFAFQEAKEQQDEGKDGRKADHPEDFQAGLDAKLGDEPTNQNLKNVGLALYRLAVKGKTVMILPGAQPIGQPIDPCLYVPVDVEGDVESSGSDGEGCQADYGDSKDQKSFPLLQHVN
jgi:hypothetical protein